jgi:hypothetical protein
LIEETELEIRNVEPELQARDVNEIIELVARAHEDKF